MKRSPREVKRGWIEKRAAAEKAAENGRNKELYSITKTIAGEWRRQEVGVKDKQKMLKDVRANCFCASLMRTKFTRHVMHGARALNSKTTIGQMAIAMTLRGFNDLGRSVTPIFLSMGHVVSQKIYRVEG